MEGGTNVFTFYRIQDAITHLIKMINSNKSIKIYFEDKPNQLKLNLERLGNINSNQANDFDGKKQMEKTTENIKHAKEIDTRTHFHEGSISLKNNVSLDSKGVVPLMIVSDRKKIDYLLNET